jgi:carboxyl-terminal processing protease
MRSLFLEKNFNMNLNTPYWLIVVVLLFPVMFSGAHSESSAGMQDENTSKSKIVEHYMRAVLVAQDNYAGEVDHARLTKASILGMLHTLDPHSSYLDSKEWETFMNEQRSRYSGIGSTIGQRNSKVYILAPFEGTPAHRAGIRYGDQIVNINGESTEGWTSTQVSSKLIGPQGTPVTVKVARSGLAEPLEFRLVRETVPLPSISTYFMVDKNTGYIYLSRGFNTTTFEEMRQAVRALREQGMTSLILDLRFNRGGYVDQAYRVVNMFLMQGQMILSMKGRPTAIQSHREWPANNTRPDDYPVVVLINRGSASAAEIVAGALQDHDRARIVGETSFGKGLVQTVFQLGDGSGLTLTTGKYYTPSGRLIQRDYSNQSFYDYIFRRGKEPINRNDEKQTDSGRKVYGGGGIMPDVEVKIPAQDVELNRVWLEPVFQFTRQLVSGQIQGFPEFKIDRAVDHNHVLADGEYTVSDKVFAAFKTFVRANKDLKVNEARIEKDAAFLKRQIRYEVITAAYGQETAAQVQLEGDAQMQAALREVPKARSMAEEIRRAWTASRSSGVRRD